MKREGDRIFFFVLVIAAFLFVNDITGFGILDDISKMADSGGNGGGRTTGVRYTTPPYCGDGIINQASEQCDGQTGQGGDDDACTNGCDANCQCIIIDPTVRSYVPAKGGSGNEYACLQGKVVVIDPGHGGSDGGAPCGSTTEAALVWEVSQKLKNFLQNKGATVIMTRNEQGNSPEGLSVGKYNRVKNAVINARQITGNENIFAISLHADAASASASGTTAHSLYEFSARFNPGTGNKYWAQSRTQYEASQSVVNAYADSTGMDNRGVRYSVQTHQYGLYFSKAIAIESGGNNVPSDSYSNYVYYPAQHFGNQCPGCPIPAALVMEDALAGSGLDSNLVAGTLLEMGFCSNSGDRGYMTSSTNQNVMVADTARGIVNYFQTKNNC
jgi:N-acetylmuramoyl-L-alanine amidase